MKVGIITLLGNNYGGILQAYALNHKLKEIGVETININFELTKKKKTIKSKIQDVVYMQRNNKFKQFKKMYLNLSPKVNAKNINEDRFKCDAYIAGSDQIWNQQIPMEDRRAFFLDFVKYAKKISYAASVGRDTIEETEKEIIKKLLDNFDAISIREKTGVNLYQPLTKNKIQNVLDPTLLLTSSEWDDVAKEEKINQEYIFSYTLGADKNTLTSIDEISTELKTKIVEISYKKNFKNEIKNINNAGPKEFIGLIKNSKYVVTNSFHGMVFSILYKKDFWVFKRGNMNSRIYDLLAILGLQDRIVDVDDVDKNEGQESIKWDQKINYETVYKKLEEEKEQSIIYLKEALAISK